jgi:hypothetical protein
MRFTGLIVSSFLLIPWSAVSSQGIQPKRGDRIRITAAPNALDNRVARVVGVRADSLFVHVALAPTRTLAVARADVTRLEVSTGRRRHTGSGAGIGALVGLTAGAVMGYAGGDDRGWCCFTARAKAGIYGVGGGALGALIGTVVGFATVSDRWTSVALGSTAKATPRLKFVPSTSGRLAMSVSF